MAISWPPYNLGVQTLHTIETPTHGRYLVRAPESAGPHPLLVGFHGYGENAEIHLEALARTVGDRPWLIVSVQALYRFYARGDRDVVASWMTREDRDLAIADNIGYVRRVVAAVRAAYATGEQLVYAGFSQGAAMAYRAAAYAGPADAVLVLGGDVPPDVAPGAHTLPRTFIGRGLADDWYTAQKAAADIEVLRAARVEVLVHEFDAGHVWNDAFAAAAGGFLDTIASRG